LDTWFHRLKFTCDEHLSSSAFKFDLCRYSLLDMFNGAAAFDQDITGWSTPLLTLFQSRGMFRGRNLHS